MACDRDEAAGPGSTIFTVGSSRHTWPAFEQLLRIGEVNLLADVRSSPRSRLPHFNQAMLGRRLADAGIRYVMLGDRLGGRPAVGVADYEAMATEPGFKDGIENVVGLAVEYRVALMCSEHEPLDCHRCLLVGRVLADRGLGVIHILRDGTSEPHARTEERLLSRVGKDLPDLFGSTQDRLAAAYRRQNERLLGMSLRPQRFPHGSNQA